MAGLLVCKVAAYNTSIEPLKEVLYTSDYVVLTDSCHDMQMRRNYTQTGVWNETAQPRSLSRTKIARGFVFAYQNSRWVCFQS